MFKASKSPFDKVMAYLTHQSMSPHPKSLSRWERNFTLVPLLLREKGLGDEGLDSRLAKYINAFDRGD